MLNRQVAWVSDSADHGNNEKMVRRYRIGVSERHYAAIFVDDIRGFFLSDDPCEDVLGKFGVVYGETEKGLPFLRPGSSLDTNYYVKTDGGQHHYPTCSFSPRGTIYLTVGYTKRGMYT